MTSLSARRLRITYGGFGSSRGERRIKSVGTLPAELHDSVARKLVALTLNLGQLESRLSAQDISIRNLVQTSFSLAEECTKEIRTLSHLLHPPLLDELGLVAACREYVTGLEAQSGLRVKLDLPGNVGNLSAAVSRPSFASCKGVLPTSSGIRAAQEPRRSAFSERRIRSGSK